MMKTLDRQIDAVWAEFEAAVGAPVDWPRDQLLARDLELREPGNISANGSCQLLRASDGWIALNLARPDDLAAVPALIEHTDANQLADRIIERPAAYWRTRGTLLDMPLAVVGEAVAADPALRNASIGHNDRGLSGLRVLDLSVLWAGPLCASLLAATGMQVDRIEDERRPDPTWRVTPRLAKLLHGRKSVWRRDLRSIDLLTRIADADILVTSGRPRALARLGLTPEAVFARRPALLWIAITAYGWEGEDASRVGFGDDCAAAGRLLTGDDSDRRFLGDALADPLTGLTGAARATALFRQGRRGLVDLALARTAACFAA